MITKSNFKAVLQNLGFREKKNIYTKTLHSYTMQVDFTNEKLIYPQELTLHDTTTSNFSHPENFVVFECVHRLLEKGYEPRFIELEPKWALGRDKKGGKADILLNDNQNQPYLLIECKSTDSKNSEFDKEWSRMHNDGGQLFSYFWQEKATKFLCLYTSDIESSGQDFHIKYQNYIINMQDNETTLKQSKKQGYKDANSVKEVFKVWSDTYAKEYEKSGIFEDEIALYNITKLKPKLENLKPMSQSEIQKKRHEWATILRANAVGDRSLALNGLMNLFLCKITDELENTNDLQFSWRGYSRDCAFDLVDRLQKLYKIGMEKYLNQTITYHSKDSIEEAFTSAFEGIVIKEKIQNIFNELKYFSNGDFNFIEVYNESLFYKNFKILLPIVLKLENISFTKNADSNILGDYFESYIHDMPQQEGQYFTPVPLVNFIIHSLPVLKNASVLDFSCGSGHFLTQYAEINKPYKKARFLGQDKDPRLAKIAKIASFMHSTDMDIFANCSLECGIEDSKFNVLISNPPYSVTGFLNGLDSDTREQYELFHKDIAIESNNAIECFFVEKASKALKSNGVLTLVLPSSFLNKGNIYLSTRELVMRDFNIIAICETGNRTFFKTGTNTIVLFALRKPKDSDIRTSQNDLYKDFYKLILENKLSTLISAYEGEFLALLHSYCTFRDYDKDAFLALLKLELQEDSTLYNNELFKEYDNAYKDLIAKEKNEYNKKSTKYKAQNPFTPSQSKQEFIRKLEAEKFLYFCYCHDSSPLIIKAPSDKKEQKQFLGYDWSEKKGKEGIQYLTDSGINAINEIKTPLYNPKNRLDNSKVSFHILQAYKQKLDDSAWDVKFFTELKKAQESTLPQDLQPYIAQAKLYHMLDFDKVEFNKAISLNPTRIIIDANGHSEAIAEESKNPFANCKYELVKVGEVCEIIRGVVYSKKNQSLNQTNTIILTADNITLDNRFAINKEIYLNDNFKTDSNKKLIKNDIFMCFSSGSLKHIGKVAFIRNNTNYYAGGFMGILRANKIDPKLLFYFISTKYFKKMLESISVGSNINNLSNNLSQVKIPLPPLEIQKQIVSECEKVEEQYNTIRMSIESYQELIRAILVKCGICADSIGGEGGNISLLLENLAQLERVYSSYIHDYTFCHTKQSEASPFHHAEASCRFEALAEESKRLESNLSSLQEGKESNTLALSTTKLQTLIDSIPTPPPQGWKKIKLGEIGKICMCKRIMKHETNDKGGTPFYKIGTFGGRADSYIPQDLYEEYRKKYPYPKRGQILISAAGTLGRAVVYDGMPAYFQDSNIVWIDNNEVKALDKFLYLLYIHAINWRKFGTRGGVIERLYNDNIKAIEIPLPPIEAQEKIVEVIETIESKIANIDSKLESLKKRKVEILNTALSNGGGGDNPQINALSRINSQIEELLKQKANLENILQKALQKAGLTQNLEALLQSLPTPPSEGWDRVRLGQVAKVQSGGTPSREIKEYWNGNINWIKSEVCQNCYVYESQVKEKITELGLQKSSAKILDKNSVLIALVGATIGKVGYLTFQGTTNQNIAGLYPLNKNILNTKFLYFACMGLYSNFKRGDFTMANLTFIKNLKIPLPPLKAQEQIIEIIETIETQVEILKKLSCSLESKKSQILNTALSRGV